MGEVWNAPVASDSVACFVARTGFVRASLVRAGLVRANFVARAGCFMARPGSAGLDDMGRETGADGLLVPRDAGTHQGTCSPPHPSAIAATLSPTLTPGDDRPRGRLRAYPGPPRCVPRRRPLFPGAGTVGAPLRARSPGRAVGPAPGARNRRWRRPGTFPERHVPRDRSLAHRPGLPDAPVPRDRSSARAPVLRDMSWWGSRAGRGRCPPGGQGPTAGDAAGGPGFARRRPLVPPGPRDRVGERAPVTSRDGAASTCPGGPRVARDQQSVGPRLPAHVIEPRAPRTRPAEPRALWTRPVPEDSRGAA